MKKILNHLKSVYQKELFDPSMLAIFINPFYFSRRFLHQGIISNAPNLSGKLLDLGCGSKPYKNIFNVDEYIGIEIGDGRDHRNTNSDYLYDGKTLPFNDNSFDSIFSSQVFEHIFNLEDIVKELHRVLKPGGKMLITLPFSWPEHEQPHDFARYTSFAIPVLFQRNGLDVIKLEKTGNYPITIFQLLANYLYEWIGPKPCMARLILTTLIIGPINLIGLLFYQCKNDSLYLDNIVVAIKS